MCATSTLRSLLFLTSSLMIAAPAYADQEARGDQAARTTAGDDAAIADIVVTAQRRSESINRVGLSITAASGDALAQRGIRDAADLGKLVPGFTYARSSYGSPVYTLRGVGYYDTQLGATPAVTVYVDEVALPFSIMTQGATLDLERVEVLKGPQGILYGQNSTGGAINYIAAKPTDHLTVGGDFDFGRFATFDGQAFLSGPITSQLKARLAVKINRSGDWQQSMTRDDELGSADRLTARLILDWQPVERVNVSLRATGSRDKSDSQAGQLTFINGVPGRAPPIVFAQPLAPRTNRAANWGTADFRRDDDFYQLSGRIDVEPSETIRLVSITAYSRFKLDATTDADGSAIQNYDGINTGTLSSFSQELRAQGQTGDGQISWIIGGNYQRDVINDYLTGLTGQSSLPFRTSLATNNQRVRTVAAFANIDWQIIPTVKLHGGVRYTDQNRSHRGCLFDTGDGSLATAISAVGSRLKGQRVVVPVGGCATLGTDFLPALVRNRLDENNVSWRAGVDWQAAPTALLYANVSKGYKNGGFPTAGATIASQLRGVTQESLLAYEAGFKLGLLDRRAQLNGAVFYYNYRNKQIRGRLVDPAIGPANALVNVPRSRITGAELQLTYRPVSTITFEGGATYVGSRIRGRFINYTAYGALADFSGEALPYTPEWQLTGDIEYRTPVGAAKDVYVGMSSAYRSSTYASFGELPVMKIDGYNLLDLRAGLVARDNAWRVGLWVRNVTNTYHWNNVISVVDLTVRYTAMPRTFGATASFRY